MQHVTHGAHIARSERTLITLASRLVAAVNAIALLLLLACVKWALVGAVVGAFGPPWWLSLSITGVLTGALTVVLWWRRTRTPWRLTALVVAAIVCGASAVTVFTHLRAYRMERVSFDGRDIRIAARIYVPRTPPPYTAVIIVPGSAPLKSGFYDLWADRIARRGLLVVVADKRGVGGTGGVFDKQDNASRENLGRLASDVIAAVHYAKGRPDVCAVCIGVLGVSQAGWVAPLAAAETRDVRFMAFVTAPTVSTREEGRWSALRGDDRERATSSRAAAERVLDTLTAGGFDPRPVLASLTIPALWLLGTDDNSIPTRRSAMVLDSLIRAGLPFAYDTVSGAGHLLTRRSAGALLPSIVPATWPRLLDWLASPDKRPRASTPG